MTTRVDINSSYFTPAERPETKEHVKGVLGYTWKITKGFASLFNLSFAIKDGQFNTGSLARYICEKYVSGQNPLQYKSLVRKAITHVLAKQRPDSLNDLIDAVLKLLAGKEVSAVLALGTNPKQVETKSQYNEISTLFDKILRAEKSQVHEISQKLNAEPSIELIREKTLGAADKLLNDTIFPQLKKLKLPESMEKILKKQPSFETYVEFVKTLRQLTGKTEHEIPDTLQNWQEVIKEATLLGELHSTIFPGLREIELLDPLARITKKLPSLATYKEFVKTLRQLTGKTEHEIPDNVENWEAVSAEANLLGQQYAATFLECAEAREKFQELEDIERTKGQKAIQHFNEAMARTRTNPLTYPLSDLNLALGTFNAVITHLKQEQSQRKAPEKQPEVRKQEQQQAEPKLATQQDPAREILLKELRSASITTKLLRGTLQTTYGAQAVSDSQLKSKLRVRVDDELGIAQQKGDREEVARLQKLKQEPEQTYQFGVEKLAKDFVRTTKETLERAIPRDKLMALLSKDVTVEAILSLIFSPPFTVENCLKQTDPDLAEQVIKTGDVAQIAMLRLKQDALRFLSDVLGNVYLRH